MDEIKVSSIDAKQLRKGWQEDFESCVREVIEAINNARTGAIISDSEELVRQTMAKFRQKVFQKAIQMKTDAAEAAFSPSAQEKCKRKVSQ